MKLKKSFLFLFLVVTSLCYAQRIALLIGNQKYVSNPLNKAHNDVELMKNTLTQLGFNVESHVDLNRKSMNIIVGDFIEKVREGKYEKVVFYYTGHGIQLNGKDYLVPIDAVWTSNKITLANNCYGLENIFMLDKVHKTGQRVYMIDACRDKGDGKSFGGSTPIDINTNIAGGTGSFVSYSTTSGQIAHEGSRNTAYSVYTSVLCKELLIPQYLPMLFVNVKKGVKEITSDQIPSSQNNLFEAKSCLLCPFSTDEKKEVEQNVIVSTYNLSVSSKMNGFIYLDGENKGQIEKDGFVKYKNIPVDYYQLSLRDESGKILESKNINLSKNEMITFESKEILSIQGKIVNDKVEDVEGNTYKVVKIGNQTWMAENLRTTQYNDGNEIELVTNNNTWKSNWDDKLEKPMMCWYNNNADHKNKYGGLYNWYVVDTKKLCPVGWHVPSDGEWENLMIFVNKDQGVGRKEKYSEWRSLGKYLKSKNEWIKNGSGEDIYDFMGLPGGQRDFKGGFKNVRESALWWGSFSHQENVHAPSRYLKYNNNTVGKFLNFKVSALSIRCVQD